MKASHGDEPGAQEGAPHINLEWLHSDTTKDINRTYIPAPFGLPAEIKAKIRQRKTDIQGRERTLIPRGVMLMPDAKKLHGSRIMN
jgi:hypothetical protein